MPEYLIAYKNAAGVEDSEKHPLDVMAESRIVIHDSAVSGRMVQFVNPDGWSRRSVAMKKIARIYRRVDPAAECNA